MIDRYCLIVGAMKCGTTSLFNYLAQHPQIAPSSQKEPEFYSDDAVWARGLEWYRGLWDWDPTRHAWALEGSTEYTNPNRMVKALERIEAADAEFRFLYVVRDPVARIESHYNHGFSAGWLSRDIPIDEIIDRYRHVIDRTRYAAALDGYSERFGRERILVINLSELMAQPQQQMARVTAFLGLEPHAFKALERVHNANLGRIVEHPVITRIRRYPRLFDLLRHGLPASIQNAGRRTLGTRLTETFHFAPETRARILALLADDLERLRAEYGVDTSPWDLSGDVTATR